MSRSRFSPSNGEARGTLQGVLAGGRASRQSPYGGSRGTYSRAGGASRAGSVRDPSVIAADLDNINIHSPDAIERERHNQRIKEDLQKLFEKMDTNRDGFVSKDELVTYMIELTGNARAADKMSMAEGAQGMSRDERAELENKFDEVVSGLFYEMD